MTISDWIKRNKLTALLIAAVVLLGYLFVAGSVSLKQTTLQRDLGIIPSQTAPLPDGALQTPGAGISQKSELSVASTDQQVVIKESYLSLLVKDVRGVSDRIISYAKEKGGLFVSSSFNQPEESPFATVSVRVPTSSLDESLTYFRSLGVKVVSENLQGTDVTDEFNDIQSRLDLLNKTKSKLENILDTATRVEDILNVQRELDYVLVQIDSLETQKAQIEKGADLTKITVYLSTDELSLPYAPDKSFRPNLIFKQAVRSLVTFARDLGKVIIWLGVYAVIWLPILGLIVWISRKRKS